MRDLEKTVKALYLLRLDEVLEPTHLEVSLGYFGKKQTPYGLKKSFFKFSDTYFLEPNEEELLLLEDEDFRISLGDSVLQNYFKRKELEDLHFEGHYVSAVQGDFEVEEQNHIEVLPKSVLSAKSPYVLYTKNISNGIVLGIYNHKLKVGTLYNFLNNESIQEQAIDALKLEIERSNDSISLSIVSNVYGDISDKKVKSIKSTETALLSFAEKNKQALNNINFIESDQKRHYIPYFAVNTWDANFRIS